MSIGHLLMRAEGTLLQVGDSLHGLNKLAYLTVGDIALRCKRSASVDVSSHRALTGLSIKSFQLDATALIGRIGVMEHL